MTSKSLQELVTRLSQDVAFRAQLTALPDDKARLQHLQAEGYVVSGDELPKLLPSDELSDTDLAKVAGGRSDVRVGDSNLTPGDVAGIALGGAALLGVASVGAYTKLRSGSGGETGQDESGEVLQIGEVIRNKQEALPDLSDNPLFQQMNTAPLDEDAGFKGRIAQVDENPARNPDGNLLWNAVAVENPGDINGPAYDPSQPPLVANFRTGEKTTLDEHLQVLSEQEGKVLDGDALRTVDASATYNPEGRQGDLFDKIGQLEEDAPSIGAGGRQLDIQMKEYEVDHLPDNEFGRLLEQKVANLSPEEEQAYNAAMNMIGDNEALSRGMAQDAWQEEQEANRGPDLLEQIQQLEQNDPALKLQAQTDVENVGHGSSESLFRPDSSQSSGEIEGQLKENVVTEANGLVDSQGAGGTGVGGNGVVTDL